MASSASLMSSESSGSSSGRRGHAKDRMFVAKDYADILDKLNIGRPGRKFMIAREHTLNPNYPLAEYPGVLTSTNFRDGLGAKTQPSLLHIAMVIACFCNRFPLYSISNANCYSLTGTITGILIKLFGIDDTYSKRDWVAGSIYGGYFIPLHHTKTWGQMKLTLEKHVSWSMR